MKKPGLFTKRNIAAAGICGILVASGAGAALAAEENAAVDAAGAEAIALADAGMSGEQAERLYTEPEREDGEDVYEVSFVVNGVEYEYLIREADGVILEWGMDGRDLADAVAELSLQTGDAQSDTEPADDSQADTTQTEVPGTEDSRTEPSPDGDVLIGMEKAKEFALADAGLQAGDVTFTAIKYENGSRSVTYELEFSQGRDEYEYTVDAYTGKILDMERD